MPWHPGINHSALTTTGRRRRCPATARCNCCRSRRRRSATARSARTRRCRRQCTRSRGSAGTCRRPFCSRRSRRDRSHPCSQCCSHQASAGKVQQGGARKDGWLGGWLGVSSSMDGRDTTHPPPGHQQRPAEQQLQEHQQYGMVWQSSPRSCRAWLRSSPFCRSPCHQSSSQHRRGSKRGRSPAWPARSRRSPRGT